MVRDHGYRQLIDNPTTDDYTLIDHICTNIVNVEHLAQTFPIQCQTIKNQHIHGWTYSI